ncbi:hypothetical protein KC19_VG252700 [Ceratodon purpureus]|uniref:Uncharacterized protein n=1 Tax=Ceratodon purpureus TaxID=3225 RepID=A0A8T0HTY4_CERPU|nr:hypothetical protein KC19_VG252700 [Ceratodon purpureus]
MANLDACSSSSYSIPNGIYAPSCCMLTHDVQSECFLESKFSFCLPFLIHLSTMLGRGGAGSPLYSNRTAMSRPNQQQSNVPSPHTGSNSTSRGSAFGSGRAGSFHSSPSVRGIPNSIADRNRMLPIRPRVAYAPSQMFSAPSPSRTSAVAIPPRHCISDPLPSTSPPASLPAPVLASGTLVVAPARPRNATCPSQRDTINAAQRQQRQLDHAAYGEMRAAHAHGRQARFPIATTPTGDIIGQQTKWHRVVRAIAKRTLDWSIREHKKHPVSWKWSLSTIQRELDKMFTFEVPVREEVLAKYVAGFISNDRSKWKKWWAENNYTQHEDCPDEAFTMLDKYWRRNVGKRESEAMREKRARVGSTSSGSFPYSDDSPSEKQSQRDDGSDPFVEYPEDDDLDFAQHMSSLDYNAVTFPTQTPFNSFESARSEPSVPLSHDSLMDFDTEIADTGLPSLYTQNSNPSSAMYAYHENERHTHYQRPAHREGLTQYEKNYFESQRELEAKARLQVLESRMINCEDSALAMGSRLDFIQADVSST